MRIYKGEKLDDVYKDMLYDVYYNGVENSPRGMKTMEINEPVAIVIDKPMKSMITIPERKALWQFNVSETIWYLCGSNNLDHVAHYLKGWRMFSDDGETLNGAYGARIFNHNHDGETVDQFEEVYKKLSKDINSRQAVITMYDPSHDFKPTKDVPCNDLINFYVRDGKLDCTIYQRAADLVNGITYDLFNLGMLQSLMAGRLGIEVGKATHIVNSLHLYERDFDMAKNIINSTSDSLYDSVEWYEPDFRLKNYDMDIHMIKFVESVSRKHSETLTKEKIDAMLDMIGNRSWKQYMTLLICHNLRKAGKRLLAMYYYRNLPTHIRDAQIARWNAIDNK